jgi:HEAT repeat protein
MSTAPREFRGVQSRQSASASAVQIIDWRLVSAAGAVATLFVAGLIVLCTRGKQVPAADDSWLAQAVVLPHVDSLTANAVDSPASQMSPAASPTVERIPERGTPPQAAERETAPADIVSTPVAPAIHPQQEVAQPVVTFKRRNLKSADELSKELLSAPQLNLDDLPGTSNALVFQARRSPGLLIHRLPDVLAKRTDLVGLPMRMGHDCQCGAEASETLQVLSRKLRTYISQTVPNDGIDTRPDANVLRKKLQESPEGRRGDWKQPEAVPALTQLLMGEDKSLRLLLIELLTDIKDRCASAALAQRALFDLSSDVREAALAALKERPRDEFRDVLFAGLRYPWPAVADHAAEALVSLKDGAAVPKLLGMLDDPDPAAPAVKGKGSAPVVRELVRVNHLNNCVMCHAVSTNPADPVRGRVPIPGQPVPPSFSPAYYQDTTGIFVRADVTYLKQDFSVPQPVAKPDAWPSSQRFDYLLRARYASPQEVVAAKKKESYPQRESVLFALRELTGEEGGPGAREWRGALAEALARGKD